MVLEEIALHLKDQGYSFVNAKSLISDEQYLQVAFTEYNQTIHYVVLLDAKYTERSEEIRRALQRTFLQENVVDAQGLLILCTEQVSAVEVNPYMPTWIVDEDLMRLVIYENQPAQIDHVREAVEKALYGEPHKKLNFSKVPIITILLVLANVVVYLITELTGSSLDTDHMLSMGASYAPYVLDQHEYYRLITHFFLHFGAAHLANNMISLIVLGNAVERYLGKVRFFSLYFLTGILAGLGSIVYNVYMNDELVVSAGASGAIYGLAGALLALLITRRSIRQRGQIQWFILYIGMSIYSGLSDPSIDNSAHICGFIIGFLLCIAMTLLKRGKANQQ